MAQELRLFTSRETYELNESLTGPAHLSMKNKDAKIYQGCVLLVDDDEMIRKPVKQMLEVIGMKTFTASSGKEALRIFKDNTDTIDCVLLDYVMPDMNGKETFRKLCKIHPEIKVLISSGNDQEEIQEQFKGKNIVGFLPKPYSFNNLQMKIKEVFER